MLEATLNKLNELIEQQVERNEELEAEMEEVANQLYELYNECNETTEPEVYGTILGLHERLEQFLKRIYSP